jgi:hypothetical protein
MLRKLFCSNAHFESRSFFSHPRVYGVFIFFPSHLPPAAMFFLHSPPDEVLLFFSPVTSTFHEASLQSQILQACESSRIQALAPVPPRSMCCRLAGTAPPPPRTHVDPPIHPWDSCRPMNRRCWTESARPTTTWRGTSRSRPPCSSTRNPGEVGHSVIAMLSRSFWC